MCSSPPPSFTCNLCKRDDRFDISWIHHLASLCHQRALSRQPQGGHGSWGLDMSSSVRAIELIGAGSLQASPVDIAEYCTKYGPLEEFICPTSLSGTKPHVISCLFKQAESVKKLLGVVEHKIFRQPIQIQRKYETQDEAEVEVEEKREIVMDEDWEEETGGGDNGTGAQAGVEDTEIKGEENGDTGSQPNNKDATGDGITLSTVTTGKRKRKQKRFLEPLQIQMEELKKKSHHPEIRTKILKDLQKVVAATFNNCRVYSYGLDFIGVCLDSDELRLCVDPYGIFAAKSTEPIVRNPSDAVSSGLIYQILLTTKAPDGSPKFAFVSQYSTSSVTGVAISEISFKQGLLPCKLQFENFLAVQKSRILKFLTNHDDRVLSMFSLIRLWSKKHEVFHEQREGEEYEGYILMMLMVFYLTKMKITPSVIELRALAKNSPLILDNMDVSFCCSRQQIPTLTATTDKSIRAFSIVSLLNSFFEFFAEFKFADYVICPSIGMALERKSFRPQLEKKLPPELLKRYRFLADGSLRERKLAIFSPVVLQDILDLTDNVSRAVDEADLTHFQSKCIETLKSLGSMLKKGDGNLNKHFGIKDVNVNESESSESEDEEEAIHPVEAPLAPSPSPVVVKSASPSFASPVSPPCASPSMSSPFNHPVEPNQPPPLLPPPAPFRMPGMPVISPTINYNSNSKRLVVLPIPPPPPKIGGLLPSPRILVRDPEDVRPNKSPEPTRFSKREQSDSPRHLNREEWVSPPHLNRGEDPRHSNREECDSSRPHHPNREEWGPLHPRNPNREEWNPLHPRNPNREEWDPPRRRHPNREEWGTPLPRQSNHKEWNPLHPRNPNREEWDTPLARHPNREEWDTPVPRHPNREEWDTPLPRQSNNEEWDPPRPRHPSREEWDCPRHVNGQEFGTLSHHYPPKNSEHQFSSPRRPDLRNSQTNGHIPVKRRVSYESELPAYDPTRVLRDPRGANGYLESGSSWSRSPRQGSSSSQSRSNKTDNKTPY